MADATKIEWCDSTFNPWTGCTKVSPGCDHCYAEAWAKRSGTVQWGPHAERRRTTPANWRKPALWNARHAEFFAQHGRRQRVFCASLADVFDTAVEPAWRAELFALIAQTPHLDWLLLTKRIGNVAQMIEAPGMQKCDLPPNVWLGATVVNQAEADRDIPKLLAVPARVHFLSMEPLLGPVDLRRWIGTEDCAPMQYLEERWANGADIDWVIGGFESGHHARPGNPAWARSLRDQCAAAGTAFLWKQNGEWASVSEVGGGKTHHYFPDGATVRLVGKKAAGRLLDGVEHNGFPEER